MAWGYWSATSVSDRGRSPRRDKDRHSSTTAAVYLQQQQPPPVAAPSSLLSSTQQQQQQQQQLVEEAQIQLFTPSQDQHPAQASTAGITALSEQLHQGELAAATADSAAVPQDPCPRMIQGGSFYTYSTIAPSRRPAAPAPNESQQQQQQQPMSLPCTVSPVESDSVDYEQPLGYHHQQPPPSAASRSSISTRLNNTFIAMMHHNHQRGVDEQQQQPSSLDSRRSHQQHQHRQRASAAESSLIHTSSRLKLLRDDDDDDELDELDDLDDYVVDDDDDDLLVEREGEALAAPNYEPSNDVIEGLSDAEFEDVTPVDSVIYSSATMLDQPWTSVTTSSAANSGGCLLHGIPPPTMSCRIPTDPAPPLPPLLGVPDHPPGEPQFWFDDITWGRSSTCWDYDDGEYYLVYASHHRSGRPCSGLDSCPHILPSHQKHFVIHAR